MQLNNCKTIQLETLKRDIRQIYAKNHQSGDNKKDKEMALSTVSGKGRQPFKKQFKGDCRICGKKGHKAVNCWDSDKNKDKRPSNYKVNHQSLAQRATLKCNYCHKTGHTIDKCFKKAKADKQNNHHHGAANVTLMEIGRAHV